MAPRPPRSKAELEQDFRTQRLSIDEARTWVEARGHDPNRFDTFIAGFHDAEVKPEIWLLAHCMEVRVIAHWKLG